MTGAFIKVTVIDGGISAALAKLQDKNRGLIPSALKNIGEAAVAWTLRRFDTETAPDGTKWAPLNPDYAATKQGGKILQGSGMRGGLMGSIVWQMQGNDSVVVGTNKIYGAIHQFGGIIQPRTADALVFRLGGRIIFAKKVTIPSRPWLGVSATNQNEIMEIIQDHIDEVWG